MTHSNKKKQITNDRRFEINTTIFLSLSLYLSYLMRNKQVFNANVSQLLHNYDKSVSPSDGTSVRKDPGYENQLSDKIQGAPNKQQRLRRKLKLKVLMSYL